MSSLLITDLASDKATLQLTEAQNSGWSDGKSSFVRKKPFVQLTLDVASVERAPLLGSVSFQDVLGPHPDYFDPSVSAFVRLEDGIVAQYFSARVTEPFLFKAMFPGYINMFFCRTIPVKTGYLGRQPTLSRGFVSISAGRESVINVPRSAEVCSAVSVYVSRQLLTDLFGLDYNVLPPTLAEALRRDSMGLFNFVMSLSPHSCIALESVFDLRSRKKTQLMFFKAKMIELICDVVDRLNLSWRANAHASLTSQEQQQLNVEIAAAILRTNFCNPPGVEALARQVGVSRSKFVEIFSQRFGMNPNAYSLHHRLCWARSQLRTTPLRVAEISAAVGYKNLSAFSRAYTGYFGAVPSRDRTTEAELFVQGASIAGLS